MALKDFGKAIAAILAGLALLGAVGQGYAKVAQIDQNASDITLLAERTTSLEQIKHDDHYMICVVFKRVVRDALPASCGTAIR